MEQNRQIMKKALLISLILFLGTTSYSQVIKGSILDAETKENIPFAAVYFNGTLVGTTSDEDGAFELDITRFASKPLTIRAMGYEDRVLESIQTDESFKIYLTPRLFEIEEVKVQTKNLAKKRKANLKLFKREFLGTSRNQEQCKILNEEDITFNYGSDNRIVKAFTRNPLRIYNGALGYEITYFLDKFEYDKNNSRLSFTGDIVFNEDLAIKQSTNESYTTRRKHAYLGSCMHFFRALWDNNLEMSGFRVVRISNDISTFGNPSNEESEVIVKYEDIVMEQDENRKYILAFEGQLTIYYESMDESRVLFLKPAVSFGKNGFFDPSGIRWYGYMAELRVADMLPYEYIP